MTVTILVVGGGPSALEAAKEAVAQGGRAVLARPAGSRKACALRAPSGIEVVPGSELVRLEGCPGRFTAHLRAEGEEITVRCDAFVLAEDNLGLEDALYGGVPDGLRSVAIVLGPAATRADHARALELALSLRSRSDRPEVILFTKEVLAHGADELAYAEAQRAGVMVVRTEQRPVLSTVGPLKVAAIDHPSGLEVELSPDLLIEAPSPANGGSARLIGPAGERNVSRGPASSGREGVFVCGTGGRDILDGERSTLARVAATRAVSLALRPVPRAPNAAQVDRDRCSACLTCVRSCPFHAPRIDEEGKAAVDGDLCQACGICVAACPSRALSLASDQGWRETMSSMFKEAVQ
jgi:heterodisulfide reductase subunit A